MINQARFLFSSAHYGYLNSDVLISTELFHTLRECQQLVSKGTLKPNVSPLSVSPSSIC